LKALVSFCDDIGEYTDYDFWYVVLFCDDGLIIVANAVLFFQGKDFIIGLRMVGHVLAAVIGSLLLVVDFFPLLLRACWIMVVALLVVLTILVVSVVVILLVVAVSVAFPIVVMGIVGIYSFWIWHLNVCRADGRSKRTLHCGEWH
jgi:hypothetical protein